MREKSTKTSCFEATHVLLITLSLASIKSIKNLLNNQLHWHSVHKSISEKIYALVEVDPCIGLVTQNLLIIGLGCSHDF